MKKILMLSVLLLTVITGCSTKQGTTTDSKNSYTILKQGEYGGRETESYEVIHTQEELDVIFRELNLEKAPAVNFAENNVVVLFLGQKNSGGNSIGIKSVQFNGDTATINVEKNSPQEGGMVTMAITNPFCVAALTKTAKVVVK